MSPNGLAAILICILFGTLQTPPTTAPAPQSPPQSPQKPASPSTTPQQPSSAPQTGTTPSPSTPAQAPPQNTPPANNTPEEAAPKPPSGVTAEPNPCLPGQTVTFYLPEGVKRGMVRGGRYTRRRDLKPDELVSDEPKTTTTYTFDLVTTGESAEGGKATPQPAQHQQYRVTVDVYTGTFPRLVTYRNPQHWRIDTVNGWIRNVIPQEDPATESLIYFQPQDDSPERVSVAVMPVKGTTCADLMKKALMDAPTQYDLFEHIQQKDTSHCGVPATWATFDGLDRSLPDMPTKSMVLTFVHNGIGYVISGRARASRYDQWEKLLHSLVRSFCVEPQVQTKSGT